MERLSKYELKCSKEPIVDVTYLIEMRKKDYFLSAVSRKRKKRTMNLIYVYIYIPTNALFIQ